MEGKEVEKVQITNSPSVMVREHVYSLCRKKRKGHSFHTNDVISLPKKRQFFL